jgi:hypothetical protein
VEVTQSPVELRSRAGAVAASTPVDASTQPASSTSAGASALGTPVLVLAQVGRGRMAALALADTWVWGLQAGRGEELAAFWRGLAEWLDGGIRSPFALTLDPERAAPGAQVAVRIDRLEEGASAPAAVELIRPGGRRESVPLAWEEGVGQATFVTDAQGLFAVGIGAPGARFAAGSASQALPAIPDTPANSGPASPATLSNPVATHVSEDSAAAPSDAWARLALLAADRGGALLPPAELEQRIADLSSPLDFRIPPLAGLVVILLLALAEWTARRLRGMP